MDYMGFSCSVQFEYLACSRRQSIQLNPGFIHWKHESGLGMIEKSR